MLALGGVVVEWAQGAQPGHGCRIGGAQCGVSWGQGAEWGKCWGWDEVMPRVSWLDSLAVVPQSRHSLAETRHLVTPLEAGRAKQLAEDDRPHPPDPGRPPVRLGPPPQQRLPPPAPSGRPPRGPWTPPLHQTQENKGRGAGARKEEQVRRGRRRGTLRPTSYARGRQGRGDRRRARRRGAKRRRGRGAGGRCSQSMSPGTLHGGTVSGMCRPVWADSRATRRLCWASMRDCSSHAEKQPRAQTEGRQSQRQRPRSEKQRRTQSES